MQIRSSRDSVQILNVSLKRVGWSGLPRHNIVHVYFLSQVKEVLGIDFTNHTYHYVTTIYICYSAASWLLPTSSSTKGHCRLVLSPTQTLHTRSSSSEKWRTKQNNESPPVGMVGVRKWLAAWSTSRSALRLAKHLVACIYRLARLGDWKISWRLSEPGEAIMKNCVSPGLDMHIRYNKLVN